MTEHTWWETVEAEAGHLIRKIEEAIAEGNVRRIRITHHDRTIADFPLTVGVVGGALSLLLAPVLAAVGAIAAVATDCKIHLEKVEKNSDGRTDPPQ